MPAFSIPARSGRIPAWVVYLLFVILFGPAPAAANDKTKAIDDYVTRWHEVKRFNGSVLVAERGDVVFKKGYGPADVERNVPNRSDTKFKILSISKQFTTVMVFQLAAEGKLRLDDKLTNYLPNYRRDTGGRVTIDHLLRHTSGIPCYVNDGFRRGEGKPVFDWTAHYDRDRFVADFLSDDLLFEPGSQYKYSNTGYYLLALVIHAVTGKTYEQNLRERILEPLGLKNTGVDHTDRAVSNRAMGYNKGPRGFIPERRQNPDNLLGAGNLYSTVEDLLVWNLALINDRVLPKEWREKMFTPYWKEPREEYAYSVTYFAYPRGSGEEVKFTGFSGGGPWGFNLDAFRFLDSGVIVVIFDNGGQYNHWAIGPGINEILAGNSPNPPLPLVSDVLVETLVQKGLKAAQKQYKDIEQNHREEYARGPAEREINAYGYAALNAGDHDLAVEIFKLNVALYPNSWNVYDSLGEAYLAAGNTELGEKNYAVSRELRDREGNIMEHLRAGRFEEARKIVESAHESDPTLQLLAPERVGPLFDRTLAAGEHDKALELCVVWALANPGVVGPYFSMARVYNAQGKTEEAKSCYRKILEMNPEGRAADAARKMLEAN